MSARSIPDDLRLALDACRADSNDLALPEIAPLAERLAVDSALGAELNRSHAFDRQVRQALDDVAVPAGLEARLLASLQASESLPAEPNVALPQLVRPRFIRRMLGSSLAIVAAGLAVSIAMFWNQGRGPGSVDQLAAEAITLRDSAQADASNWSSKIDKTCRSFPFQPWLVTAPSRCRTVYVASDSAAVYDLLPDDPGGAILVVIRTRRQYDLQTTPQKISTSGDVTVKAWRPSSSLVVYVLAVEKRFSDIPLLIDRKVAQHTGPHPQSLASR